MIDLVNLRKIAENATPGGWIADGSRFNHYLGRGIGQVWGVNWRNDLQFITTFHPLQTLALLDRVEKAEQERDEYRDGTTIVKLTEAEQAIARVRELHRRQPDTISGLDTGPAYCRCGEHYPCPTIRALEGDE